MTNTSVGYDWVIIGGGLYGCYAALQLGMRGKKVLLLEHDAELFSRASYINQARIHLGYHYPRSLATALTSIHYYERFIHDYDFAINKRFTKIYATSTNHSFTTGEQFAQFCARAGIPCREINSEKYFLPGVVDQAFESEEFAFDAATLRQWFGAQLESHAVEVQYKTTISAVDITGDDYSLALSRGQSITTAAVLNTAYASTNQIAHKFNVPTFEIKYEICEVILCDAPDLTDVGITVMDGPFFSVMPFGESSFHSLTAVPYTPHRTSHQNLPTFSCQAFRSDCSPEQLANCNTCTFRPHTAWEQMLQMTKKYLRAPHLRYCESLFAIKPILEASEVDDARPTVIREARQSPRFLSVLSGKINTIYDMDPYLHAE